MYGHTKSFIDSKHADSFGDIGKGCKTRLILFITTVDVP